MVDSSGKLPVSLRQPRDHLECRSREHAVHVSLVLDVTNAVLYFEELQRCGFVGQLAPVRCPHGDESVRGQCDCSPIVSMCSRRHSMCPRNCAFSFGSDARTLSIATPVVSTRLK